MSKQRSSRVVRRKERVSPSKTDDSAESSKNPSSRKEIRPRPRGVIVVITSVLRWYFRASSSVIERRCLCRRPARESSEHRALGTPGVSTVGHTVLNAQNAGAILMIGEFQGRFRGRIEEGDDALGIDTAQERHVLRHMGTAEHAACAIISRKILRIMRLEPMFIRYAACTAFWVVAAVAL